MHRLLPALAFLSGASGVAYEVLYARLLSSYLGDIFYVTAILLATFFIGIAIGAYVSWDYVRQLKYIEIFIGAYALVITKLFSVYGFSITALILSVGLPEYLSLSVFTAVVLLLPAIAIGFSIPLFARYMHAHYKSTPAFSFTYAIYNFGAALSVLAVEYVLIRNLGISTSIYSIAAVNILIGLFLFRIAVPSPQKTLEKTEKSDVPKIVMWVLLGVSVISGVVQLNILNLFQHVIGPLDQNFALVISVMLLGVTIAAIISRSKIVTLPLVIAIAVVAVTIPFVFLDFFIGLFSTLVTNFGSSAAMVVALRFGIVSVLVLPVLVVFGLTVPTVVKDYGLPVSGMTLAIASLGNSLGYIAYLFVIFERLSYPMVLVAASIGLTILYLLLQNNVARGAGLFVVSVAISFFLITEWPKYLDHVPYTSILDSQKLRSERLRTVDSTVFKQYGGDAAVTKINESTRTLMFNGYQSLYLSDTNGSAARESLIGTVAGHFVTSRDDALVIGLGTGITAAGAARVFERVTAVEINPAVVAASESFTDLNDNVLTDPGVSVEVQDGVVSLLTNDKTYDAIINTVTSPTYFAANKLWTKEFFELSSRRLRPGGVFVGWVDVRLTVQGVEIMQRTLDESFIDCVYLELSGQYFGFICSNVALTFSELHFDSLPTPLAELLSRRAYTRSISDLTRDLLFVLPEPHHTDATMVNTLDRPLLENVDTYTYGKTENDAHSAFITLLEFSRIDPFTGLEKNIDEYTNAVSTIGPGYY